LHSNVEPGSLELNEKLGSASLSGSGGDAVIVVSGSVRSIVQAWVAGVASVFPAKSVALTSKVCEPAASPVYALGEVQEAKAPASSLHSKVEPASEELKEKLASVELVGSAGLLAIVVWGSLRSIVQV
jgi:hypothetical protein